MVGSLLLRRVLLLLLWMSLLHPAPAPAGTATIPNVELLVLRLDYRSYTIKGGYRFSQPFRKTVLPEGFVRAGNVHYKQVPAGDIGYTEIRSRLTGQLVARAGTVWAGTGSWQFPASPLDSIARGGNVPDPASLDRVRRFGSSVQKADSAWASARQAVPLEDLAATGAYEVVVFDHYYSVGFGNPATAEWIVVAFSRPPAPPDVGILAVSWPYTVITRGIGTVAEAKAHNFSDGPETFALRLEVRRAGMLIHGSTVPVGSLPEDSASVLTFAPFVPDSPDSLSFSFAVVGPSGEPWADTFSDNDGLVRGIGVVEDPVFRPVASLSRPGTIPTECEPLDLDGDGDQDLFQYGYQPVLWQRGPDGSYANITGLTPFSFPPHPRTALAEDFDRDGHPDLLVVYFSRAPVLLRGDGTGAFVDATAAAGLSGVTGYGAVAVLDLEGDGDLDLIFPVQGQEVVLANDGLGHFADVTASSGLVDPSQTEDVAVGDVNGDGHPDVFLTNWNAPSRLFVNDGDGTFTLAPGPWSQTYGRQALFLDADGDGRQDLLFLHDSQSWFYRNLGGLAFVDLSGVWGLNQPALGGAVSDLNGDGLPEVLLASLNSYALLSSQGGTFANRTRLLVNVDGAYPLSYVRPRFVDLNGDGRVDVYQRSAVYIQTGGGPAPAASVDPPRALSVTTAFPNPFSPAHRPLTLRFRLADRAPTRVSVWDVGGRVVRTLFAGTADPGDRVLEWDGRDEAGRMLPSGLYFCTVETRGERVASRIALLR